MSTLCSIYLGQNQTLGECRPRDPALCWGAEAPGELPTSEAAQVCSITRSIQSHLTDAHCVPAGDQNGVQGCEENTWSPSWLSLMSGEEK